MSMNIEFLGNFTYIIDKEIKLPSGQIQFEGMVIYSKDAHEPFTISAQDRSHLENYIKSYTEMIIMEAIDQCKEQFGDLTITRIKDKIKTLKSYLLSYNNTPKILEVVKERLFNLNLFLDYKKEALG